MVFESVVADLLNRFLGDYVENLDKSQLKLGIWGGNVVLENLLVKENALSELDVPFKVKAGQIGKLTLKIPWKNLYNEAVVATLDGLCLLVVPGASIKYDAEKEEKQLQETKQKEVQRIEEALQKAAAKDKSQEEKKDTFLEKLATQVIKNVQVKITSIHIRYEDDITDSSRPISLGITLGELSLLTADENWKLCVLNEAAKVIYKLVSLDCLCAYWNVKSSMYYHDSREQILRQLKGEIASSTHVPEDYHYIFRPILASAKLCINTHAEHEHKSPKINLNMEVQSIAIEMTKPQYLSMIDLLESVDYMVRNIPYRKYRPDVPLHKNSRLWWNYAIESILEVHIRRHCRMWSWTNIKKQRECLKSYKNIYKNKLIQSKVSEETQKQCQDFEKSLDVFNITLARQQAQVEAIRSGHKVFGKKPMQKEKRGGGWFSGLWGKKESKKNDDPEEQSVPEAIEDLMTAEEKAKLYTAIGYSGSSHNLTLPKQYVATVMTFKLVSTSITIRENVNVPETLKVQMIDLSTQVSQRPGAQALKVETRLEHWYVTGLQQGSIIPSLVASVGDFQSSLLSVEFETNPEGSAADQVLAVQSQPVEIVYDARTVNALVEFFQSSRGMDLEQLTSATLMKLEEIKEKTAAGLSRIIETRKVFDLQIQLKPSYLVVPQTGFYDNNSDLLILDFGSLQLNSVNQNGQHTPSPSFSSLEEIMDRAYEKFDVELKSVQLLYSKAGEDWKVARCQDSSVQHILQPMDIKVQLAKAMVEKDSRMAMFKVSGELPLVHVRISDQKIKSVLELVDSIPLPPMSTSSIMAGEKKVPAIPLAAVRTKTIFQSKLDTSLLLKTRESVSESEEEYFDVSDDYQTEAKPLKADVDVKKGTEPKQEDEVSIGELTDLQLKFEIKEVIVELTQQENRQQTLLVFNVAQLGMEAKVKTHDLTAVSYLRKITLDYHGIRDSKNQPLHLISSSDKHGSDLLKVEYIKADKTGPNFKTAFDNTEQMLKVAFSSLDLLLHTQALLSTINFLTAAVPSSSKSTADKGCDSKTPIEEQNKESAPKTAAKSFREKDFFDFKLFAKLDAFNVNVCDEKHNISDVKIQGLNASIFLQSQKTEVFARLKDIIVIDVCPKTVHKKAVSKVGEEVFNFSMVLYPNATEGEAYTDMSKVDGKLTLKVGCIQVVYLNKFLMSLLNFFDNFHTAKEALSAATAQAAELAASSVKDFAQQSFRLSMDIYLKAPVIIIPQSSVSKNAIVADLGLITVQNEFSLISGEGGSLPPVIDRMKVKLNHLKLSRTILQTAASHHDIQILQPINLDLSISRNLAATWYHTIPSVEVEGDLKSMNVILSQEDLSVLMKILVENLGEGTKEQTGRKPSKETEGKNKDVKEVSKSAITLSQESASQGIPEERGVEEEIINVFLNFEIREVVVQLTKPVNAVESLFLVLNVVNLGTQTRVRNYDMNATAYLKKISMKCLEFTDPNGQPLHIINSSDKPGADLLKIEYIKADRNGPHFKSTYNNTEQTINVAFSSLDLLMHTQALLSTMNFLTAAIPSSSLSPADKDQNRKVQTEEHDKGAVRKQSLAATGSTMDEDIFDLKLSAKLGAFNVFVCDEKGNIADIKIQGMDAFVSMQSKQTEVFARLKDIIVTDVDPNTIHKKAVSIVGGEVFNFSMVLYPGATEGEAYTDMSKVDGKMTLKVGCIQVIYLNKFLMSLLNFLNNFQTAKEALSAATAQAAELAASSMKDFAQKSFRLLMDINLKAPVIIIPQSSTSQNAVVADLGRITVQNEFNLVSADGCSLPPVIDRMDVQLNNLKLSRTVVQTSSAEPELEILQPINLLLSVRRNLAASWYQKIPAMEIHGDLKPLQVALSQDDLTVVMKILLENLGEGAQQQISARMDKGETRRVGGAQAEALPDSSKGSTQITFIESAASENGTPSELCETLKFDFNFESLSVVLYTNDPKQTSLLSLRNDSLRLGELRFYLMTASGKMFEDGSIDINTQLRSCTLDDLRKGIQRVTSRMIDKKDDVDDRVMIDVNYKQSKTMSSIVAVLEKLYVCASVEFLLTVADFFIKAMPQSPAPSIEKSKQVLLKQIVVKSALEKAESLRPKMSLKALIVDPEIVFVANLMKNDAPALVASFQCDFFFSSEEDSQAMTAILRELKVSACPFLQKKKNNSITTVLQPCSLFLDSKMSSSGFQNVTVMIEEVIIKISPVILNTVMTIMSAMKPKPTDLEVQGIVSDAANLWTVRNVHNCNYWFLGVDMAKEASETACSSEKSVMVESFDIDVQLIQVTLECGLGHCTIPLLLMESTFSGTARNWTSLLNGNADATLEVHYYNEMHAVWEPLIERVDEEKRRWNLTLEMKTSSVQDRSPVLPGDDSILVPEPQTLINISSKDVMNITVSRCCLNVFLNLAKAFSEGTTSTYDPLLKDKAPYTVKNALGVPLTVQHSPNLQAMGLSSKENIVDLTVGETLELEYSAFQPLRRGRLSVLQRQESSVFGLTIVPHGYTEVANVPIAKPGRRLYNVCVPLQQQSVSALVQIDAAEGNKVITVRSPLQIKNHFAMPFTIYKSVTDVRLVVPIGVASPEQEFHVPLDSYRCQLFVRPAGKLEGQYKESTSYITWKEELYRSTEVRCVLQCPSAEVNFLPLIVNTVAVPDQLSFISRHGEQDWDPAYIIHLHPPVTIRNLLPYAIRYLLEGTAETYELAEGSSADVLQSRISGEIMELVLIKYQGRNWNGHIKICPGLSEFFPVCFTSDSQDRMILDLSIHAQQVGGGLILSVFSPYWIINRTGRVLQYRAEEIHMKHPADQRDIVLFSFKRKTIFSKNKIHLRVSTSDWSSSFSLDTVGSYGCVKCPANTTEYLVGVSFKMSSFNLTRIVTMSPFYILVNQSSLELEVGEVLPNELQPNRKWHYISATECLPFWPENASGKLCVRVVGSEKATKSFFYNKLDNGTLLSLEDQYGGIIADVDISEHSTVISFTDYYEGAAPALIVNYTLLEKLKYKQSGIEEKLELKPGETCLFAWADPTGTRKLTWSYAHSTGELDLIKDQCGQFAYNQNTQIHWVSFLDGRQRVLLFTEDVAIVSKARQAEEMEQADTEIVMSLQSLGISLVNNETKQEISYISITSSGVVWEHKPKQRWKPFSQKNIQALEQAYQKHLCGQEQGWVRIENLEVNFSKSPMEIRLPVQRKIRRNFTAGIHVEFKQSPHQRSLRAQLNWLQIDNQLSGAIFPIVFYPVAPPKSIAMDSEPKPFIDVSIITRFNEHSQVMQFKYFMVLIQEMALKVDQDFLGAVMALFTPATNPQTEKQRTKLIEKDVEALKTELMETSMTDISSLSFFEHFHISPIKLHLSVSLGSRGEESDKGKQEVVAIQSVNLLLKSIGATLTDVDDLIFKLAFFEVKCQFYKRDQLMWSVIGHYTEQFLKQLYVLVLGLDVLGNPFGLIRGLSEGVEAFFYEPFQGAVQGPEEFAEGFVIGVRSLFGHTVGGAAGVVSRITGSVGKGLAAITMDKEYQQKRREEMNRQPKDFGESLAKGGKGLLRGVVGGVTGIVTKPMEGAKKEGAAGFFKGIGKGLVGVVARPTGGIIDMASSTFQGIQRAAESTEEVAKVRPPRLIREDGIIRPFNITEAEGNDLLEQEME
ncbi:intermembrane lipid transfer protein VPS13C isoform X2 [Latimeria chalumnae]|uniref:intermembrane lipid transfer protein VPS13C isoform X2 n=1 Tax=Latimeria chalumnae TaxID=7897 RepID=UPI00313D74C1